MSLKDWLADMANVPALLGDLVFAARGATLRLDAIELALRDERHQQRHQPRLATVTVLCERRQPKPKADEFGFRPTVDLLHRLAPKARPDLTWDRLRAVRLMPWRNPLAKALVLPRGAL